MQDSNLRMHESKSCALPTWLIPNISGERTGIRTPDTRLRRALLYPAELCTHVYCYFFGRGEGTRTPGPMVPNQVRYQTALHLDLKIGGEGGIRTLAPVYPA